MGEGETPFYFADKPAGVTTQTSWHKTQHSQIHSPIRSPVRSQIVDPNDGFAEFLSDRLRKPRPLFVVHRLDKEITGAIVFATTSETAALVRNLFVKRLVRKRVLFVTDRPSSRPEFRVESRISHDRGHFVSRPATLKAPANALTRFKKLKEQGAYTLWEAWPETGQPHQIRLHAKDSGLEILGDSMHGGGAFPGLCLHSSSLSFECDGAPYSFASPPPVWFEQLELLHDQTLCRWLAAIDRRHRLLRSLHSDLSRPMEKTCPTLRWIHSEGDPLRAEQLGPVTWLSWFADGLGDADWRSIQSLVRTAGWSEWYLQKRAKKRGNRGKRGKRGNRGQDPRAEPVHLSSPSLPARWLARERELLFEFRRDSGLSPGLFLDQRRNRLWVMENSAGKSVLNLFCYTGGFSVAAAKGGAGKVVSVDVSKPFLEWARRNFEINGLETTGHEFRALDSREYLDWARKKELRFDLVICDPPSFARSKSGVFRIERDFTSLFLSVLAVLAPKGTLLFASNYEKWTLQDFENRVRAALRGRESQARLRATPAADWDFELPGQPSNMKSFFLDIN